MVNLKYAMALLMALNLFFIALSLINYFELQRLLNFSNDLAMFSFEAQDLGYSLSMLEAGKQSEFCTMIDEAYTKKITRTNDLMQRMLGYEKANLFSEFMALKRQFLLSNIQLWQVSTLQKEYCLSGHSDILYIYSSNPSCGECTVQGHILDSVREECANARIFVMDFEEDLTTLSIIKEKYSVTSAPSLVIGGNTYSRVLNEGEIRELVSCNN